MPGKAIKESETALAIGTLLAYIKGLHLESAGEASRKKFDDAYAEALSAGPAVAFKTVRLPLPMLQDLQGILKGLAAQKQRAKKQNE